MSRLLAAIVLLCLASSVRADAQCMNMQASFNPMDFAGYNSFFGYINSCTALKKTCVLCGTDNPQNAGLAASAQAYVSQFAPFFDAHNCWSGTYSLAPSGEDVYNLPSKKDYIQLLSCAACNYSVLSCAAAFTPYSCPLSPSPSPSSECEGSLAGLGDKKLGVIIGAAAVGGFLLSELIMWVRSRFTKPSHYPQSSSNIQM